MEFNFQETKPLFLNNKSEFYKWTNTSAYNKLLDFILKCNDKIISKKISDSPNPSKISSNIVGMLNKISQWTDEIEPIKQEMRYGNTAFRTLFDKIEKEQENLIEEIFVDLINENELKRSKIELKSYLLHSFGNRVRIDYGTGHETNFVALLVCLDEMKLFGEEDYISCPLFIFDNYLKLIRKIQQRYGLEPAGSHGAWSLDDYQFIPFLWGSSQLKQNKLIFPQSIANQNLVNEHKDEYLYLSAINYIHTVKKGPFAEHSPILYSLTSLPHWEKTNEGMIKMYKAEVLAKYPIIQHFHFGSILHF